MADGSGASHFPSDPGDTFISDLRSQRVPRLFIISGPSGVGKDSVIRDLRARFPGVHFAVTATTRKRRPGEVDGVDYFFLDDATFADRLNDDKFLESAVVYGHRYGVPRQPVRHALARGQDVIIKVDVQGAEAIREHAPDATYIFVAPGSMTDLLRRLRSRKTEDPDALMARYEAAERELREAPKFDYIVFNETDQIDRTISELSAIIAAERVRVDQKPIVV